MLIRTSLPLRSFCVLAIGALTFLFTATGHAVTLTVTNTDDSGPGSLRQTIADASSGDAIIFDSALDGATIRLTSATQLTIDKDLVIDASALPSQTITLSGDANDNQTHDAADTRVLEIAVGGHTVELKSIIIRDGYAIGFGPNDRDGGGIFKNAGILTLTSVSLISNLAGSTGGGILNKAGDLTVNECTLNDNSTSGGDGGAILNESGTVVINSSSLKDNSSEFGGCLLNYGTLIATDTTFSDNSGFSGGVLIDYGTFEIHRCLFSENSASYGGAIYKADGNGTLTHSTLVENSAADSGGAIHADGNAALNLHNVTITSNSAAAQGGGVGNDFGTLQITSSIITGNTAPSQPNIAGPITTTDGFNLMSGDPILAPLGWYGGPTQTMPPLPGSPAIDAAGTADPGGTDQRGFPRFAHGALDIGAVEFSATADLAPIWATNTDGDPNAFGIEFALGTDSALSDPAHANAFRITGTDASGKPKLTFGINPIAMPYTTWIVKRSTTLLPDSWSELYRYHGPTEMQTTTGTTATPMSNLLEVIDDDPPPNGPAFYLFEAEVAAP